MVSTNKGDFDAVVDGNDVDGFFVYAYNVTELVTDGTRHYWYENQDGDWSCKRLSAAELERVAKRYDTNSDACEAAREIVKAAYDEGTPKASANA